jgi:hypothetical protein
MYIYEYERINSDISGWGMLSGSKYGTEEYKEIISKRASDGWRYVDRNKSIYKIEIILTKEVITYEKADIKFRLCFRKIC